MEPVIESWLVPARIHLTFPPLIAKRSFSVTTASGTASIEQAQLLPSRILVVDDEEVALMVIPESLRDGLEELGWQSDHRNGSVG